MVGGCYYFSTSHSIRKTALPRAFVRPRVGTGALAVSCNNPAILLQIKHIQSSKYLRYTPPDMLPGTSCRRGKDIVSWLCRQSEDSLGLTRRPSANNTSSPEVRKRHTYRCKHFSHRGKDKGSVPPAMGYFESTSSANGWLGLMSQLNITCRSCLKTCHHPTCLRGTVL